MTTAPPEFRREVIRQGNRRGYNATEVEAVVLCADWAYGVVTKDGEYEVPPTESAVTAFLEMWEESFDVEP